jgi:hypothetical protein
LAGSGSKRWLLHVAFYVALAASIALGVAGWYGVFGEQYEYRDESIAVLKDLTGDDSTRKSAYDNASPIYQEATLLTNFVDRADRLTQTFGRFKAIVRVKEIETLNSIRGKTARIVYSLRFENVTTPGELSYLQGPDKKWKLLGYKVKIPSMLAGKADMIRSEYDRIKAPAEVVQLVDETLRAIDEGRGDEIRAKASPPFRESTDPKVFATTLERYRTGLGPFQRRLKIHKSGQNASKTRARVHVLLQFEKATTSGSFEFIKKDGVWRLLHLKVLIPEPLFPDAKES